MAKSQRSPDDIERLVRLTASDEAEKIDDGFVFNSDGKNLAAVALGRRGGLKGGKARAETLSAERRSEIARKAAGARWKRD